MSKDDSADVRDILDPDQIKALVAGYDQSQMNAAVQASLVSPYPRATPWVAFQMEEFFIPQRNAPWQLTAANRERVLLGVLAGESPLDLGIHVYWAIAQGEMAVQEIAECLLLASTYKGVDAWSSSVSTLSTALSALAVQVDSGDASSTGCVGAIFAAFK